MFERAGSESQNLSHQTRNRTEATIQKAGRRIAASRLSSHGLSELNLLPTATVATLSKRTRPNFSRAKFAVALGWALVAANIAKPQESAKAPTTSDGFTVSAVWHAYYKYEWISRSEAGARAQNYGGCAEGTPIITDEEKEADAYITEEVNNKTGQIRAVIKGGDWSWKWRFDDHCNSKRSKKYSSVGGFAMAHVNKFVNTQNGKQTVHFDLAAGKPTQGTHQQSFPMVCEGALSDGNVTCSQDDGDSQVNGLAHIDWYSHLSIIRHGAPADAVLVTPRGSAKVQPTTSGDGQNMYTFDKANPGRLVINFKARTIPPASAAELYQKTKFQIDPIGDSTMTWDPANPDGQATKSGEFLTARLTLTGLPIKNSDFGEKTVKLLIDGDRRDSARPEIFFPKFAINHPGGVKGDPNWFYYWKDGNVCGIRPQDVYDGSKDSALDWGWADEPNDVVHLCPMAPMANSGPETYNSGTKIFGSITVTGRGKGIKCAAETMQHEGHHIAIYKMFTAEMAKPGADPDGDCVPSTAEPALDMMKSSGTNPDTFRMGGDYSTYGDDEIRCRKTELNLTVPYYPERDWAWPGCQSVPAYGP